MSVFVRKNLLVCSGTFIASDGSTTQPTSAQLVVTYPNLLGVQATDNIPMTYNATTGVWSASWDSSRTQGGRVDWVVYGSGTLTASTQGSINIVANSANVF